MTLSSAESLVSGVTGTCSNGMSYLCDRRPQAVWLRCVSLRGVVRDVELHNQKGDDVEGRIERQQQDPGLPIVTPSPTEDRDNQDRRGSCQE